MLQPLLRIPVQPLLRIPYAQTIFFDISVPQSKNHPTVRIGSVYRSPSSPSPEQTDTKLAELIRKIADTQKGDLLIAGDFNLPTITWKDQFPYVTSDSVNPMIDMIHDTCLHQIVDQPSRFMSGQLPSLLDQIFL